MSGGFDLEGTELATSKGAEPMGVDYSHSIKELEGILRDLGIRVKGDVVKTASRKIIRLRQLNEQLAKELDVERGLEGVDPVVRAVMGDAARLIHHQMAQVLNAQCVTVEALEVQANAMKRLAEALSILARGITFPDIHAHGVEDFDKAMEGDADGKG
jgi:hypothetical protein